MIRQGNIFAPGGSTSDDDLIEWIIREEGFNKVPEDIGDGKMTLGSGLTDPKWHALYKKRGNKWSATDNRRAVAEEVASRRRWAEKNIPNWGNLPDSAQKALISYKYNYDFNAKNSPKLFDALSRGDYREAAKQIDATSKNPDFKNGLMKRRRREQAWFLSDFDLPSDTHTLDTEVPYTPMSMLPFSTAVNNPYILPEPEPMMIPREDEYVAVDYDAEQRVRENALRALENQRIVNAIQMMGDWSQKPAPKTEVFQPSSKYNFVVNRNADGGQLNQWDNLSLAEKAEMMKVAIKNGVTDLNEIKDRYNEFAEGGHIYDGESEPTQQMKLGRDYWQSQVAKPSWYDTIDPPINGKPLQEIIVTPTDDQNWLFSQGKYARNSRQPLADESTRKVVAKYLSKYDNEDATHYNDRVTRLADAIYRTNGVIFKSNNVKEGKFKNRAHYNPNEGIAYVNSMDDLFSELAHPYQDWLGNNWDRDEYVKEYDADIDPRGGTRYAYPDTFEGETHGFFEPALTEYITTGKISRSLPILNKTLSNEKITPKDWKEVTDSATSWDKQAIDRRIISMPSQLPLFNRIKYSIIDYPLLEKNEHSNGGSIYIKPSHRGKFTRLKERTGHSATWFKEHGTPAQKKMATFALNAKHWKHGLGGNLFDGLTQPTQFMEEDRFATTNLPEVTVTAPRKYVAGYDDNGNPIYTDNPQESMGYTPYTEERTKYQEWANRDKNAPKYSDAFVKAAQGLIGAPLATIAGAPVVEASMPVMEAMARPLTTTTRVGSKLFPSLSKALPYTEMADRGLMGYMGAKGAYDAGKGWYNGEMPWYQAVPQMGLSALMVADAAPVVAKGLNKASTFMASPYTGKWTTVGNRQYRLSPNSLGANGIPLESRAATSGITTENAASITPEVTHFYHGSPVRFDAFSADFIGSGEGGSKVMRGINLWPTERIANAPKLANIRSSDAPLHLGVPSTPLGGELNPTVYDVSGRGLKLYTASPREVKGLSQSDLISQGYDGIQTPNQVTVFPESIGKLSIDKQSTIEEFVRAHPEVEKWTPWTTDKQKMQNIIDMSKMSKWTSEQWTAAQDAAIARGDMAEAQRLRDLHSNMAAQKEGFSAYNTYHGQAFKDITYRSRGRNPYSDDRVRSGYFSVPSIDVASTYNRENGAPVFSLYTYLRKPFIADAKGNSWQQVPIYNLKGKVFRTTTTDKLANQAFSNGLDGVIVKNVDDIANGSNLSRRLAITDDYISKSGRNKLRDAVTYDDNGVRIPLGLRDNFKINDIRWGLLPFAGITGVAASRR